MTRKHSFSRIALALVVAGGCQAQVSGLLGKKSIGSTSSSGGGSEPASAAPAPEPAASGGGGSSGGEDRAGVNDIAAQWALFEVAPKPFAPKVGPTRPSWCSAAVMKEMEGGTYTTQRIPGDAKTGVETQYGWGSFRRAALGVCLAPDGKRVQEQTGYLLQALANEHGFTGEEATAYLTARIDAGWDDAEKAFCATLKVDEEGPPVEVALAKSKRAFFGCDSGGFLTDFERAIDRAADPAEWARAYAVKTCFHDQQPSDRDKIAWAHCGIDAKALDGKRLEKEIAKLPPVAKAIARREHDTAQYYARQYEAIAKDLAKDDKAWKALLLDVPARAWKAWTEAYGAHKARIDGAVAFEDVALGKSKSAARGCTAARWRELQGYVAERKAKSLEAAKEALMTPVGNVLLRSFALCLQIEGDEVSKYAFKRVADATPTSRGPRHAVTAAVLDELAAIRTDREKFPVEPSWIYRYNEGGGGRALLNLDLARDDKGAVIKSIKKEGDMVRVEFKKEKHREREYWCEDTKKIIGWNNDGSPQYYRVCKEGKMITVDDTHAAVVVPAVFAAELAPGRFARFNTSSDTSPSVPVEIWDSPERKKLIAYLGLAL